MAEGVKTLTSLGFRVVLGPHVLKRNKYLAGTDAERLSDLCTMFRDRGIDGVICLRGGYGSMRILSGIDYSLLRRNPKVLMGYSDITALQLAIWKRTGLVTFSGPMLATEFGRRPAEFTLKHFLRAVAGPAPLGHIPAVPGAVTINPGRAAGRLLGGNLSLVAATLGTPYEIDTRGAILFLEEVGEHPYRVDRLLSQLLLAGKLRAAAGVVFGECVRCEAEEASSFSLLEVIRGIFQDLGMPCYYGLSAGHSPGTATLPLGVRAEMDAGRCLLEVCESATRSFL